MNYNKFLDLIKQGVIMKVSTSQSELVKALSTASKALGVNSTMPVLQGIMFRANNNYLRLEATDLDFSCQIDLPAAVELEGEAILPGKLILDIVKSLPDAKVTINVEDNKNVITCQSAAFSTGVLNANEFPSFPEVERDEQIVFSFSTFQNLIKKVKKCVSKDESSPAITGVYLEVKDGKVRSVATDSYRIAIAEEKLDGQASDFSVIIPAHFLDELTSLKEENSEVRIACNDNQVIIEIGSTTFINRKIEGNFPDVNMIINFNNETTVVVDKDKLKDAIKRVSILSNDNASLKLGINPNQDAIQLTVNSPETGTATEIVSAKCDGIETTTGLDSGYLMDGLNTISTNDVVLTVSTNKQPAHIYPCVVNYDNFTFDEVKETADNLLSNKFLYLVMPVYR